MNRPLPPLRVAFVCFSNARGGLELMLVRLAESLRQLGHSVLVISPTGSAIEVECARRGVLHDAVTPRLKYLDLAAAGHLRRIFASRMIQIVVVGASKDMSTVVLTKRFLPLLKVVFFQQMQSGVIKKDAFHRWVHGKLDRWITLTQEMKKSIGHTTSFSTEHVDVVKVGVDLTHFNPVKHKRSASRRAFGLPQNGEIVGLVGRFDPQKGQEEFLAAASMILKKRPKTHFVLVGEETKGEPGYLERLMRQVEAARLSKHVQFLPFTDRVPELLSSFDVIAMPSHSETYGYLAIESMAMGVPVVGTNAGGLPEIIQDNKTGLLVPPKDPDTLATAIMTILWNKRLRRALSAQGRRLAVRDFDYGKSVERFYEVLAGLVT